MPCSNGFCIMPFPKQPSKDAAVEQWISPWWWLWWSNQTHLIFVFCHNPTSFVADNVSEPFTVWISISQPTGAAGNKEDFLQCMRNQRQTFRKNKNHTLYKTHSRAQLTFHFFSKQLWTFIWKLWNLGPEKLGVDQLNLKTKKMNSYSVDDTFFL